MGRTSDARERLIEAGQTLLGQKSYGTVGVADICTAAGVPKGSFYYFFPSKQDLALAVIDRHWDEQRAQWSSILTAPTPIAQRIHDLFLATEKVQENALAGTGSVQGCLFGNLSRAVLGRAGRPCPPARDLRRAGRDVGASVR
jgi:TetR/AcrR family transcriptional regulator, transcriptional repressor for nem operon